MRDRKLQQDKIKRVLFYFRELERLKVSHAASLSLMTYVFHVKEERLLVIYRENDLDKLQPVKLHHPDLDIKLIDAYVSKIKANAKQERKEQMSLFGS